MIVLLLVHETNKLMVLLIKAKPRTTNLEDTDLVGNIHGLRVSSKAHEGLLESERSDHGVDLLGLHSVELVHGVADLLLVGTEVNNEGEDVLSLQSQQLETIAPTSIFFMADSVTIGLLMTA